jgi:hypothetical protein
MVMGIVCGGYLGIVNMAVAIVFGSMDVKEMCSLGEYVPTCLLLL